MARAFWTIVIVLAVLVAAAAGFLLGMRLKIPFVVNAVRRMNRSVMNPVQMKSAGQPGAFAAVIHHVGRNSGKPYETPIGITPYEDGYLVALPYGSGTDWLKNLEATGSATIVYEGDTIQVDQPRVVPLDTVQTSFSTSDQLAHQAFGVTDCLLLHRAD
jgi:deazaflavin-dependent oxidoreductase (nitroreductase family)